MTEKDWAKIYKALGNENRIKIIRMLYPSHQLSVTEIQQKLGISYRWVSINLNNLKRVGIVESEGKQGRVFYYLNPSLSRPVRSALQTFNSL